MISIKKFPIYYGFVIMICAILAALVSMPGQTVGVSAFTDPLIHALHMSRLDLSTTYMVGTLTSAFIITRAGGLIDRYGARIVGTIACFALGCVLLLFNRLDNIDHYFISHFTTHTHYILIFITLCVSFFMLRFTGQGTMMLVANTLIAKWFVGLRGRVASVVGIFSTVGFSLAPPTFNALIQNYTWEGAYLRLGLLVAIIFPIILFLLIRNTPESEGLTPDGKGTQHLDAHKDEHSWTLREAKKTYVFWVFNIALAMQAFFVTAVTFNITSIFHLDGMSREEAISVFFPAALIAIGAKIISGYLIDKKGLKDKLHWQCMFYLLAMILSVFGLIALPSHWGYWGYILGSGIATGLYVTLAAVIWAQYFGRRYVGSIGGFNMASLVFASAIGPIIFSGMLALSGSYHSVLALCAVAQLVLLVLVFFGRKPEAKMHNL